MTQPNLTVIIAREPPGDLLRTLERERTFMIPLDRGSIECDEYHDVSEVSSRAPIAYTSSRIDGCGSLGAHLKIFTRHLSDRFDTLVVESPETRLYPTEQQEICRFLARLVNSGIRVIINTLSDWIVLELNNLIMLNGAPSTLLRRLGYRTDEMISHTSVDVYETDESGLVELEVTPTGVEVPAFDRAIEELNSSKQEIYHTRIYGDDE